MDAESYIPCGGISWIQMEILGIYDYDLLIHVCPARTHKLW